MEAPIMDTWDSVLLDSLTEDNFINNLYQRYKRDHIYTYIGTSLVAINPYHKIVEPSVETIKHYESKGIFQLPPHIYGLSNLALQMLKNHNEDQCIILTGESGSGKTESFNMIVNFLTRITDKFCTDTANERMKITTNATPPPNKTFSTSPIVYKHRRNSTCYAEQPISDYTLCKSKVFSRSTASGIAICQSNPSPLPGITISSCDNNEQTANFSKCSNHSVLTEIKNCKSLDHLPNAASVAATTTTPTTVCYSPSISTSSRATPPTYPKKQCFKHNQQTNPLVPRNASSENNCGTHQCKRNRYLRAKSLERDNPDLSFLRVPLTPITKRKLNASPVICIRHSSCSNLYQKIAKECSDSHGYSAVMGSNQCIHQDNSIRGKRTFILKPCSELYDCIVRSPSPSPSFSQKRSKNIGGNSKECVAYADSLLQAMGNAATTNNKNSSRYGKLFDVQIDYKGDPIGVHITTYMLEKTRITSVPNGERNFHIFYQLLLGADLQLLKSLKLHRNIERYELLKDTTANKEDQRNLQCVQKSLEVLDLNTNESNVIYRVIASVLKLGNLKFVPNTNIDGTECCCIVNNFELKEVANLLSVDSELFENCLTKVFNSNSANDDIGCDLNVAQAKFIRDTLCRNLYGRLFTWLVIRINRHCQPSEHGKHLALLDFYGFQSSQTNNSFEQFAINYSAEKIHQHFVYNILRLEQEAYVREGLEWMRIDYFDNASICDLIDKPNYGILNLMNETRLTSNTLLLQRIQQCCAGHPNFMCSGQNTMSFSIRHYAHAVSYSINNFLEKNSDVLPKYISSILYQSQLPIVQNLFPEGNPRRFSLKKPTPLSSNIRTQLQVILSAIQPRQPHYIFCIKPNDEQQAHAFDIALVQHQVRYMLLMPLVHLYRMGYCYHLTHAKFFQRYKLLNSITWPHYSNGNTVQGVAIIIRHIPLPSAEFTIGTKHVFVRSPRAVYELEQFRRARLNDLATLLQKTFRCYRDRKLFLKMRHSQLVIGHAWRNWKAYRDYRNLNYNSQIIWAVEVIARYYRNWKIREYLLSIPLKLPTNSLSPLSMDWPPSPKFLSETSYILRIIYHRWKCNLYRNSFDQTSRNRMREKVTASIIFKDRKASYAQSVALPFIGDYVRLRHNLQWKQISANTNDQYVVFADIINKISRSSGRIMPVLLVVSTSSLLLLNHKTLQIKYRIPAAQIFRMSLSPFMDDIAVFHIKTFELLQDKGDFVFQTNHIIEIVTKMFLVIQNAAGKPPEIHISTEFEANFGQQTVVLHFKCDGLTHLTHGLAKIIRKADRMEIIV